MKNSDTSVYAALLGYVYAGARYVLTPVVGTRHADAGHVYFTKLLGTFYELAGLGFSRLNMFERSKDLKRSGDVFARRLPRVLNKSLVSFSCYRQHPTRPLTQRHQAGRMYGPARPKRHDTYSWATAVAPCDCTVFRIRDTHLQSPLRHRRCGCYSQLLWRFMMAVNISAGLLLVDESGRYFSSSRGVIVTSTGDLWRK